jgi:hypothetical protein
MTKRGRAEAARRRVPASHECSFRLWKECWPRQIATIERIDVLWLDGRSIVRAFEVEDTTAVYSGLLRMADLLALIPNMDVRLHIVAPDERRDKVFSELQRPVFSLVNRTPLSRRCTFISYDSVEAMRNLEHLGYTNDRIIKEYEEPAVAT